MSKKTNANVWGPFNETETRAFLSSMLGHPDTQNLRFDLDTAAAELADKRFDAAIAWQTLEDYRHKKWSKDAYRLGAVL